MHVQCVTTYTRKYLLLNGVYIRSIEYIHDDATMVVAVPLYAPTVKLPWRTAYLRARVCPSTTCDLTFVPPTPAPSPENSHRTHYSLVCVRVDVLGGDFRGHASGEGANAQHALRINAVTILLVSIILYALWLTCNALPS